MVERKEYLDALWSWKEDKVIKVITGIRRCGKSTLLYQFQDRLKSSGVDENRIISLNFEDLDNEYLKDYRELHKYLTSRLSKDEYTYIFLDEVQMVSDFQKVVDSLYIKPNVDLYITGSNAYLLSGELATLLSGRYVEINLLPLSFKEYYELKADRNKDEVFSEYLLTGGFPYVAGMDGNEKINAYLEGIYNTVIVKDIEERDKRKNTDRNKRKITDTMLLKTLSKYLSSVIGSPVSIKSIADYLNSNGRKTSSNTVGDYVESLIESYIFYVAERFDIVGKNLLRSNAKYYIVDTGLRNLLVARQNKDIGYLVENTVYFELLRRGYKVNIGKIGNSEVDFVAQKNGVIEYYQVTATMIDENTFDREMKPLCAIKDNYKKTVLTLDRFSLGNYNGIEVRNITDWLIA